MLLVLVSGVFWHWFFVGVFFGGVGFHFLHFLLHFRGFLFLGAAIKRYHKLRCLKTIEMYLFSHSSGGASPKSRCLQDWCLLKVLKESLLHASLLVSGGCWQSLVFLSW